MHDKHLVISFPSQIHTYIRNPNVGLTLLAPPGRMYVGLRLFINEIILMRKLQLDSLDFLVDLGGG